MSRDIKFEVWDKIDKKMMRAPHIFINGSGVIWENKRDGLFGSDELVATDRYKIRLATGLTDKNGKEIYEGDVVGPKFDKANFVIYRSGSFCLVQDEKDECPLSLGGYINDSFQLDVVGNIYENPELLNKPIQLGF